MALPSPTTFTKRCFLALILSLHNSYQFLLHGGQIAAIYTS